MSSGASGGGAPETGLELAGASLGTPGILRLGCGCLAPCDVLPGKAWSVIAHRCGERVEVGLRSATPEQYEARNDERPSTAAQEIGVVEVRVDARREPPSGEPADEIPRRMRRRHDWEHMGLVESDARRRPELRPCV